MKRFPALLFSLLLAVLVPQGLTAGPARRGVVWHTQPDGTQIQLRLTGDEFGHTYTTLDGRPVIIEEDGKVRLRTKKEVNELQKLHDEAMTAARAQSARGANTPIRLTDTTPAYRMRNFPVNGEIRGVVLLVEYSDVSFTEDSTTIHDLLQARFNADNYNEPISYQGWSPYLKDSIAIEATITGSARDYFRDQSFGKFVPQFDVYGPIRLPHNRIYYGGNSRSGSDSNARGMIKDACQQAYSKGLVDFSQYDNDNDGFVDFVFVVFAGNDEAQYGSPECIWASAWNLSSPLKVGSVSVYDYACSAELCYDADNIIAGIGTFVHEFSHVLGLPDFYNTSLKGDDKDFTMDYWSVMDYGMYNCEGYIPAGYTSFERYSLGWLQMETLTEPADITLAQTDSCRKGYRTFVNDGDTTTFYVFENIQRVGWNAYAPTYGLEISCVSYNASSWLNNTVNGSKTRHRYHIVPANNDYNYMTANEHLFGKSNHSFGPDTSPASITQFGDTLNKPLTDIQRKKGAPVTFKFMREADGIATLKEDKAAEVFTLDGKRVFFDPRQSRSPESQLPAGIYIVKEGEKARKLLVR